MASEEERPKETLASRMKRYELETPDVVPDTSLLVVRCDGHKFSRFTKGFRAPFDERIKQGMLATTEDAVRYFAAVLGFTVSDEITLVFPACRAFNAAAAGDGSSASDGPTGHPNGGRVQKLASNVAGYVSVRFAYHMAQCEYGDEEEKLRDKVMRFESFFDGRCIDFESAAEVANCLIWRSMVDGKRNSISTIARYHLGPKAIDHKKGREMLEMLRQHAAENGTPTWEDYDPHFKWGTYMKREPVFIDAVDRKTGQPYQAQRTRITARSFAFDFAQHVELVLAKYWPEELRVLGGKDKETE